MFPAEGGVIRCLFITPAALLILGLTSCNPRPDFSTLPTTYKTVAVISLLPKTISMNSIGFTVFQNHFAVFPTEFDPNVLAIQTTEAKLASRYQIKDLGIDQKAFFTAVQANFTWLNSFPGPVTDGLVADQLKVRVKPGQADLIVVIDGTQPTANANFGSGMGVEVGLASTSGYDRNSIGTKDDHVHLAASLEVFDGTTWQVLGYGEGGTANDAVSDLGWDGEPYNSLTPVQKQKLTDLEQQVIRGFVADALPDAHLTTN